jgi:hypothetical protein
MFHPLPIQGTVNFRNDFTYDGIILLRSSTLNLIDGGRTTLDLLNAEGDVILHLAFVRGPSRVVFNTRHSESSSWEREEHILSEGKFVGQDASIMICDHRDRFQILINNRTAHYFRKRFQGNATAIAYNVDAGQKSLFSEYLTIDQYSCLADLLPRGN